MNIGILIFIIVYYYIDTIVYIIYYTDNYSHL